MWKKTFNLHQKSTGAFKQGWWSSMSNVWGPYRDKEDRGHLFLSQNNNRLSNVWGLIVWPWAQPGNTVAEPNPSSLIVTTHSSLVLYTFRALLHLLSHLLIHMEDSVSLTSYSSISSCLCRHYGYLIGLVFHSYFGKTIEGMKVTFWLVV